MPRPRASTTPSHTSDSKNSEPYFASSRQVSAAVDAVSFLDLRSPKLRKRRPESSLRARNQKAGTTRTLGTLSTLSLPLMSAFQPSVVEAPLSLESPSHTRQTVPPATSSSTLKSFFSIRSRAGTHSSVVSSISDSPPPTLNSDDTDDTAALVDNPPDDTVLRSSSSAILLGNKKGKKTRWGSLARAASVRFISLKQGNMQNPKPEAFSHMQQDTAASETSSFVIAFPGEDKVKVVERELYITTELINEVAYLFFSVETAARSNMTTDGLHRSDEYSRLERDLYNLRVYRDEAIKLLECIIDDHYTAQPPAVDQLRAILQRILRVGSDNCAAASYFDNVQNRCAEFYLFDFKMKSCPPGPSIGSTTDSYVTHAITSLSGEETTGSKGEDSDNEFLALRCLPTTTPGSDVAGEVHMEMWDSQSIPKDSCSAREQSMLLPPWIRYQDILNPNFPPYLPMNELDAHGTAG